MGLPFLKSKEGSMSAPVEVIERDHDEGFDMLDAIADDILSAVKSQDKARLKEALGAFVEHIQEQDAEQDKEMEMK